MCKAMDCGSFWPSERELDLVGLHCIREQHVFAGAFAAWSIYECTYLLTVLEVQAQGGVSRLVTRLL